MYRRAISCLRSGLIEAGSSISKCRVSAERSPEYENSIVGVLKGIRKTGRGTWSGVDGGGGAERSQVLKSAYFSSAAPGEPFPNAQSICSALHPLSKHALERSIREAPLQKVKIRYPIDSSLQLARMVNEASDLARTSIVCPPDSRRVRNGNAGGFGSVRKTVKACACM